jgi:hypothetical protein
MLFITSTQIDFIDELAHHTPTELHEVAVKDRLEFLKAPALDVTPVVLDDVFHS